MAEPLSDFSKILELQEIKKLYDELQEKNQHDIAERDEQIRQLQEELDQHAGAAGAESDAMQQIRSENERLQNQLSVLRDDYEAKIERLKQRLKELTSGGGQGSKPPTEEKKGFFRR